MRFALLHEEIMRNMLWQSISESRLSKSDFNYISENCHLTTQPWLGASQKVVMKKEKTDIELCGGMSAS